MSHSNPWDVHFYWTGQAGDDALEIRARMMKEFPNTLRFYNPHTKPIGPHPVPMWEADFNPLKDKPKETVQAEFNRIIEWLKANRGTHSVLVHPHTNEGGLADHTKNAIWVGPPLTLKLDIFG